LIVSRWAEGRPGSTVFLRRLGGRCAFARPCGPSVTESRRTNSAQGARVFVRSGVAGGTSRPPPAAWRICEPRRRYQCAQSRNDPRCRRLLLHRSDSGRMAAEVRQLRNPCAPGNASKWRYREQWVTREASIGRPQSSGARASACFELLLAALARGLRGWEAAMLLPGRISPHYCTRFEPSRIGNGGTKP